MGEGLQGREFGNQDGTGEFVKDTAVADHREPRCILRPFQKEKKKGFWWWQLATDEGWQEDWCVFRLCQEITLLGYVTEHIRATHQSSPYVSSRKPLPDKVLG